MKKIKTYERIQNGIKLVAGIIEKTDNQGRKWYNVFCKYKLGHNKIEQGDTRTIHDRQKALENSYTLLEQVAFEL